VQFRVQAEGQLAIKANYAAGERDGPYEEYHEEGQLLIKANYAAGERDGPYEEYWLCFDPIEVDVSQTFIPGPPSCSVGQLREKSTYTNGVINVPAEFYFPPFQKRSARSLPSSSISDISGSFWGQTTPRRVDEFVTQGEIFFDKVTFKPWTGPVFIAASRDSTEIIERFTLRDGKRVRYQTYYRPRPDHNRFYSLQEEGIYVDGKMAGPFERYREDGALFQRGIYIPPKDRWSHEVWKRESYGLVANGLYEQYLWNYDRGRGYSAGPDYSFSGRILTCKGNPAFTDRLGNPERDRTAAGCVSGGISDYQEGWVELVAEASSPAIPDIPFDERWGEAAPRPSDQVRLEDEYVLIRESGELYSGSVVVLFSCMYGSPRSPYMGAGGCTWRSRDPNSNNYDPYVFTDGIPHPQHPVQIRVRYNVTNGKRDGPFEEYYPKQISSIFTNSSGKLRIKSNYVDGERDGPYEEYYANGSLRIKTNFVAEELDGLYEEYSSPGRCESFTDKRSRPPVCLPSQLEEKATYQNGVLDGPFEAYYHDGLLRQKSTYTNGVLDVPTEFYFPSGILWGQTPPRNIDELVVQGGTINPTYLDPETFEPWTGPAFKLARAVVYGCDLDEYSYPGQVQTRLNLKDGKPDGEYESYWMQCRYLYDGLLKERGVYRDGQLDGPFERYVWDEFRGQEGVLSPHLAQKGHYQGGSYPANFGYSDHCNSASGIRQSGNDCVKNSHGEIYPLSQVLSFLGCEVEDEVCEAPGSTRGEKIDVHPGVVVGALEEYRWNGSPAELSRVPSTEEPVPVQAADPGSTFSAPSAEERVPAQADDPGSAFSIATASDDLDESLLAQLGSHLSDIENANEDVSIGPMFHSFLGDLPESGRETVSLTFPENERLLFYGVCDNDCEDLDLVVKDAAGNVLAEDTLDGSFPQTVLTTGSGGTTVQVEVSMAKCTVEPCYYAVGVSRIPN